jgi:hypothetical protein
MMPEMNARRQKKIGRVVGAKRSSRGATRPALQSGLVRPHSKIRVITPSTPGLCIGADTTCNRSHVWPAVPGGSPFRAPALCA